MFKKLFRRVVSVVLVFAMLCEVSMPLAYAAGSTQSGSSIDLSANEIDKGEILEASDETIAFENVEGREEYTKDYRLTNGSDAVFLYPIAVHEKDTEDKWVEIDNQLKLTEIKDGEAAEEAYAASGVNWQKHFYTKPEAGRFFTLYSAKGKLSWGIKSIGTETFKDLKDAPVYTEPEVEKGYSKMQLKSLSGVLTYKDVLPGTDLKYQLLGKDVEEAVVLTTPESAANAASGIRYILTLEGYTAEVYKGDPEDGNMSDRIAITANGDDEPSYLITASFMEDAAGADSGSIRMELVGSEQPVSGLNVYTVTICPDPEWLLSEDRVFPITIDPTVLQYTNKTNLDTCTVYSNGPGTNLYNYGNLMTGKEASAYQKMRAAVRFTLPSVIKESDMVIDATISLKQRGFEASNASYPCWINAYPITSNIAMNSLTWNNLNNHFDESFTYDNRAAGSGDNGVRSNWDITAMVKNWYQYGANYGVVLKSQNEDTANRYVKYYSAHYPNISQSQLPIVEITYINQEGLESYLSYHTAGTSTMGEIAVGDFRGSLIYTYDDLSMSGSYMPIAIQHVFSETKRDKANLAGSDMHFGLGFRLNLSQRIITLTDTTLTSGGYHYKHVDADGTEHYFKYKSGTAGAVGSKYEKEFETTTILTKTSTGFTLDYNGDLVYSFNASGYLSSITDTSNGKTQTLTYTSDRLTSVTDGAGRTANLSYDTNGYLTAITDPSGRQTQYTYTDNRLTCIKSPDNEEVVLSYTDGALTGVTDIDGYTIAIEYYASSKRVKSIEEFGTQSGAGGKLSFAYESAATVITDRNGLSETYLFDNTGHTVCITDSEGKAVYGAYENSDDNNKHSLKISSNLQGTVRNALSNHGFEGSTISPWSAYSSSGSGSLTQSSSVKYLGAKALALTSSSASGEYGVSQSVTLDAAGGSVTLSAMVNTGSVDKLLIELSYKDAGGSWVPVRSPYAPASDEWQPFVFTADVPETAQSSIRARLIIDGCQGTVYIDNVQLEKGKVANRYNLLENAGIRDASNTTVPSGWTGTNLNADKDKVKANGIDGNAFVIYGDTDYKKQLKQSINISGSQGDTYVFGAWGKAHALCLIDKNTGDKRVFGVAVRFVKPDNTYKQIRVDFDAKGFEWQYLTGNATAPFDYVRIDFLLLYYYQKNYAVFDDAQLFKEGFGNVLEHDDKGRVTDSIDPMGRKTTYEYAFTNRSEISKIKHPDDTETNYTYDSTSHRLLSVTDPNGKTAVYDYDNDGNNQSVHMTSGTDTLCSGVKNFGTAGYVTSQTDSLGNTTNFAYDTDTGLVTSVTDPNSAVTSYSYNTSNDLLTGLTKGSSYVSYTYSHRRLTGLSHSGGTDVSYGLSYDQFGTRTDVKVGTQSLASYTYASYNGELTRTDYGNGTYTEPVYDQYYNQTGLKVNGTLTYRLHYGADGRVGLEEDLVNDVSWRYLYNAGGEITSAVSSNGEQITNSYKGDGKVEGGTFTSGGVTVGKAFEYDQDNKFLDTIRYYLDKDIEENKISTLSYSYDVFERASRTLTTSANFALPVTYTFKAGVNGATTTLIPETIRTTGNGWIEDFKYDYDCMGNISAVWKKTDANGSYTQIARYAYDQLNQLVREDNAEANRSYAFSYDTGGNILSVSEYSYTLGDLGTPISTKNYAYSDQNWGDKLTSFDNQTITYDAIGNPLSYRSGMSFTWQNGRQLASATKNSVTASYSYNTSGTRISKNVGGVTTNYTLAGNQVVKATTGSDYILYFYDSEGAPVFFRTVTNGIPVDYYYVKNLQGDIVAICDASGNKKVEYTYDAWGKVMSISGDMASTIGQSNPYRYRGYWFDSETGLYYLQSRYYDPEVKRFINADEFVSTGQGIFGCNMFAYGLGNPVNGHDDSGQSFLLTIMVAGAVGSIFGGLFSYGSYLISCAYNGEKPTDEGASKAVLKGMFYGFIGGSLGIPGVSKLAKVSLSLLSGLAEGIDTYYKEDGNERDRKQSAVLSGVITAVTTYSGAKSVSAIVEYDMMISSVLDSSVKYGNISVGFSFLAIVFNRMKNKIISTITDAVQNGNCSVHDKYHCFYE